MKKKIEIGNDEYLLGITENDETFLHKFDTKSKKEIQLFFSNDNTEKVADKIMQKLSNQYINSILTSQEDFQ